MTATICYRCRELFEVPAEDITPLGYLCDDCFQHTAADLAEVEVAGNSTDKSRA